MESKDITRAPIWDDVRTLNGSVLQNLKGEKKDHEIDIITGGFPCQDISIAGAGAGLEGMRSGLFFEIIRLVSELRPQFVFLENVPAITVRGLDRVLMEFTALGFDCRWTIVSAAEVGAPHLRERWFLLATDSNSERFWNQWQWSQKGQTETNSISRNNGAKKPLANSEGERCGEERKFRREFLAEWPARGSEEISNANGDRFQRLKSVRSESQDPEVINHFHRDWWSAEPEVGRVVNGLPNRSHRIKGLGNAVVPLQTREAFERLMGLK